MRQQAARGYLESVRRRPLVSGRATVAAVGVGEPAEVILDHAARQDVDLIVMATHGRSGFRRWMLGSTAEKIVHAAPNPLCWFALVQIESRSGAAVATGAGTAHVRSALERKTRHTGEAIDRPLPRA